MPRRWSSKTPDIGSSEERQKETTDALLKFL